jgi:hypothetical protein
LSKQAKITHLGVFFFIPTPTSQPEVSLGGGMEADIISMPAYEEIGRADTVTPQEPWPDLRPLTKKGGRSIKKTDCYKQHGWMFQNKYLLTNDEGCAFFFFLILNEAHQSTS